jgi:hypothetical protein
MAGTLDEISRVRTNGNGYIEQEWDNILLQREISQLVAEGRVREVACPAWGTRRFHDVETGDTYDYISQGERGLPRFYKIKSE